MRALRVIAVVLALWAVAATIYVESGVRSWIRTPSPTSVESRKRTGAWAGEMIAGAAAGAVVCWSLASLLDWSKRTVSAQPPEQSHATDPPDAGPPNH